MTLRCKYSFPSNVSWSIIVSKLSILLVIYYIKSSDSGNITAKCIVVKTGEFPHFVTKNIIITSCCLQLKHYRICKVPPVSQTQSLPRKMTLGRHKVWLKPG